MKNLFPRFPDITSLAESTEEEVIQYWKRSWLLSAKINLRKGAVFLKENFQQNFPETLEETLLIPGVGPYTARAVLSIAYNKEYGIRWKCKASASEIFFIQGKYFYSFVS